MKGKVATLLQGLEHHPSMATQILEMLFKLEVEPVLPANAGNPRLTTFDDPAAQWLGLRLDVVIDGHAFAVTRTISNLELNSCDTNRRIVLLRNATERLVQSLVSGLDHARERAQSIELSDQTVAAALRADQAFDELDSVIDK